MMRWLLLSCLLASAVLGAPFEEDIENAKNGTIWAVLVAGSNTWDNYRHQADICHAYQILHRHGVPKKNIIVFMADDIAKNSENPNQGVIINKPNGTNVYTGVNKDYTGSAVTPANFIAAITGNSKAANGKKVLKSGPNDHVFMYFADHGGTGELCFPNYDCTLYADDLNKAIKKMHKKKMYKKLLFYVEACEAGSMFDGLLPSNINAIVTTASNPDESSYGTYCDTSLYTCLGDEYSVAWMEDTDEAEKKLLKKETILKQYNDVVANTPDSHPQMYGQTGLKKDLLKDYIGINSSTSFESGPQTGPKNSVPSREVFLHNLNQRIKNTNDVEKLKELQERRTAYLQGRQIIDYLFSNTVSYVETSVEDINSHLKLNIEMFPCYKPLTQAFRDACVNTIMGRQVIDDLFSNIMSKAEASDGEINSHMKLNMEMFPCYKTLTQTFRDTCVNTNMNGYVVGHHYKLANLCLRDNFNVEDALKIFSEECKEHHRQLSGIN